MEKDQQQKLSFGLIGKNIDYSFSRAYFAEKFSTEDINATYVNFDCPDTQAVIELLKANSACAGFNVTIPYKQDVIAVMQEMDEHAANIGAVNVIKPIGDGKFKGYNSDYIGFSESIQPYLKAFHTDALLLGTGGASKAVAYALKKLGILATFVSRKPVEGQLSYEEIDKECIDKHSIIINTTPLGTYPNVENHPDIPYSFLGKKHLLYDLVYNPKETQFLKLGKEKGAQTCNGLSMLKLQAEAAWNIWNS